MKASVMRGSTMMMDLGFRKFFAIGSLVLLKIRSCRCRIPFIVEMNSRYLFEVKWQAAGHYAKGMSRLDVPNCDGLVFKAVYLCKYVVHQQHE